MRLVYAKSLNICSNPGYTLDWMDALELHSRLHALAGHPGDEQRTLRLGRSRVRIEGLDPGLAAELDVRWGGFLTDGSGAGTDGVVRLFDGGPERWLEQGPGIESYRLEALNDPERRVIASYHFAMALEAGPHSWRLGLTRQSEEPRQRCMDNALRFVTALLALEQGGFAMHAAGVLRDDRAFLLAGPSRAGKTTAVRLCEPAVSLGDDFAVAIPGEEGWVAPALPFDNSERAPVDPPAELYPVAGIWRLHQASSTSVEDPPRQLAIASLLGCTAFPWALPESSSRLLEQVQCFVEGGGFHHLHFADAPGLWSHLI